METMEVLNESRTTDRRLDPVIARFRKSVEVPKAFFASHADGIAQACWQMARRFHQGGRLLAFGNGAWASDAQHVSVEFVHPVIVGKRALPAIALTNDSALLGGARPAAGEGAHFDRQLSMIARPQDIAMGFSMSGSDVNVLQALKKAQTIGMLTVGMTGLKGGDLSRAGLDFCFSVASDDAMAVQETHETLYHILWELVHVFFEHEGLLK